MSANWRLYFPKLEIRFGVVALVGFGLQLLAIYAPLGLPDIARRVVLVISYLLLLGFILGNLRRPGLVIIGAGLLLNFLAIASNGGLMPISPETLARADWAPQGVSLGDWLPRSKDVLLAREDIRLWILTDRLVWNDLPAVRAFSVGDVVIVGGLIVTLGELFLPRLQRRGGTASV